MEKSASVDEVVKTFTSEVEDLGLNKEDDLTKESYRLLAAQNCLRKFYLFLNGEEGGDESLVRQTGGQGVQEFSINIDSLPVTAPLPKRGARFQASGEGENRR